jgi:S1-C subfamily serine protease
MAGVFALVTVHAPSTTRAANRLDDLEGLFAKTSGSVVTLHVGVRHEERAPSTMRVDVTVTTGSGIVVHPDGFIVTAAHVVELAEEISVEFQDGSTQDAEIVTLSRTEDVALLKVSQLPRGVKAAVLSDSDTLKVGQPIFSISAPLGLKHTLSSGVISALRNEPSTLVPRPVIQTDLAMSVGDSGGGVFDARGELIGVASFIAKITEGAMGVSFSVPSNLIRRRLFDAALPYIGVGLRHIPREVAELLNWPYESALLIEHVRPGSAAERAGLRGGTVEATIAGTPVMVGGDLIIKVGDLDTTRLSEIGAYLHRLKTGDKIRYTVVRGGKPAEVVVVIDKFVPIPKLPNPPVGSKVSGAR